MNTKQLTYPTIQEQQKFWINKEAQSNNATPETREDLRESAQHVLNWLAGDVQIRGGYSEYVQSLFSALQRAIDASNLNKPDSTTADPKPQDIGGNELLDRIEASEDWYAARNV